MREQFKFWLAGGFLTILRQYQSPREALAMSLSLATEHFERFRPHMVSFLANNPETTTFGCSGDVEDAWGSRWIWAVPGVSDKIMEILRPHLDRSGLEFDE